MTPPPDTTVFPLAQIRDEIRAGDDAVRKYADEVGLRVKDHAAKNMQTAVAPIEDRVREHHLTINGRPGDSEPGIVRGFDLLRVRMTNMEATTNRTDRKLDEVLDELRMMSVTSAGGKTPRNGTRVEPDSERPAKRGPLIDKDTLRLLLIVLAALAGTGGGTAAFQAMSAPPEQAVQVQAEAVAEKKDDLERRERELARREAWVARQVALRRSAEPTMPEPVPATGGAAQ